ncbi:hypothetical protein [Thiolapillus sp.]|uniref:hypothetical protein n=1 Tax=Thiolapillus sp. TaxID=2017437 RepID=UPI003AF8FCF8
MTGRDFSYAYFVSPLRYRTPDIQCGPGRYRGLTAFASLSMAVSGRYRRPTRKKSIATATSEDTFFTRTPLKIVNCLIK